MGLDRKSTVRCLPKLRNGKSQEDMVHSCVADNAHFIYVLCLDVCLLAKLTD
ncbi:hypothetical protein ES703_47554 [subsurface metagenome]